MIDSRPSHDRVLHHEELQTRRSRRSISIRLIYVCAPLLPRLMLTLLQEIKERSLIYEGLKHYLLIRFAQRPGACWSYVNIVASCEDDCANLTRYDKGCISIPPPPPPPPFVTAGALKEFVTNVLGPNDDIVRFEYLQKNNRVWGGSGGAACNQLGSASHPRSCCSPHTNMPAILPSMITSIYTPVCRKLVPPWLA